MSTGLLGFQSVQERPCGVWDYVSASRLSCWAKCPLAFRFRYLDGIRSPTTPNLFLGKAVHAGLEVYYRHRQLGVTLTADEVAQGMLASWAQLVDEEEMAFDSTVAERSLRQQATNLVKAYLAQAPENERPLAVEVAVEALLVDPTTGEDLGIPLVGVIDLVLDYEEGPLVIDFKTTARSSEPLEVAHEVQLSSYSYVFRHGSSFPEAGLEIRSIIKTKVPKIEFHHWPARTEAHFRRLFAVIREYLDALDSGRFNYRPGWGCAMCDFRESHCRKWQK
jgi:putative RecB family exonuclease